MKTDLNSWLTAVLDQFHCQTGTIHQTTADGQHLDLLAQIGVPEVLLDKISLIPFGKCIAGAAAQTREALAMVDSILREAGSGLDRAVQVTMLITDPADYAECNAEYVKHFPGGLPARHTARFGVPTEAKVAFACIALAGETA